MPTLNPTITGVGVGWMVMFAVTVESHPEALAAVRVISPEGTAFQFTIMAVVVLETIVPPVTDHV
jgi:hypothetical protein